MINGHGDDIYGKTIVSNFSSNIYNGFDVSELDMYLREHISSIHSYPEPDAASLASLISKKNNISSENICLTNGATEAIYLIAQAFRGKNSSIVIPTFSEYEDACKVNEHKLRFLNLLSDFDGNSDLVWLCNPNNPTGKTTDKLLLLDIIKRFPRIIFVIDQSYGFFTLMETLQMDEATAYPNVILLHSMTKRYVIPGLRLGYITGCESVIDKVRKYCMPWSVNQLAIEAGKYLLQNDFPLNIQSYLDETNRFAYELDKIKGLNVYREDTNFFLCKLAGRTAKDLKSYLIDNHGILIRDAANFRGLDEHYFRVATQSFDENNNLIKAIKEWI